MKVVIPIRPVSWIGGENYLQIIRLGIKQIRPNSAMTLVGDIRLFGRLHRIPLIRKIIVIISLAVDLARGNAGINFPWAVSPNSKKVLRWIPDCQDLVFPDYFTQEECEERRIGVHKSILRNHAFYFSSQDSKRTFIRHYGNLENIQGVVRFVAKMALIEPVEENNTKLVHLEFLNTPFIYMPNQWWKHKNHLMVIEAFQKYRANGGSRHLVLTGTESDYRNPGLALEIRLKIADNPYVHALGVVSRSEQMELFLRCDFVLQPSLFEGWSTTIEESLYLGVPILASNIEVNIEQLQDCEDSETFDPNSIDELARKLNMSFKKLSQNDLLKRRELRKLRFYSDLDQVLASSHEFLSRKHN
jgi:glycosyltransferase involved in cell wall biosynthesis